MLRQARGQGNLDLLSLEEGSTVPQLKSTIVLGNVNELDIDDLVCLISDNHLESILIEQIIVHVDLCHPSHVPIEVERCLEAGVGSLEVHLLRGALEGMGVGPRNSFKLLLLWGTIFVEHAFFGASRSREISKRLVLPVCPRGKAEVKSIG